MFSLYVVACFAQVFCSNDYPPIKFVDADRCFQYGAILSGVAVAQDFGQPTMVTMECTNEITGDKLVTQFVPRLPKEPQS